jgi:hypothetical protein
LVLGSEAMPSGVDTKTYDFRYHTKQLDFDHVLLFRKRKQSEHHQRQQLQAC